MNAKKDKTIQKIYWYIIGMIVLACVVAMIFRLGFGVTFSLIFSFIFVFILPGFSISLLIWSDWAELSVLARIITSVAISIVVVPLTIFYGYRLVHLPVNRNYVFGELAVISVGCLLAALFISMLSNRKNVPKNMKNKSIKAKKDAS